MNEQERAIYLSPTKFIDADDRDVVAFAREAVGEATSQRDKAMGLYFAVRDGIRYDPYRDYEDDETYRASSCLREGRGYCVAKAALLAAGARVAGIPARVSFADVRNHLCTPRLRAQMGSDVFIYHGIAELYLGGKWVKATPTFNIELCRRFQVLPLDFDGENDALMHPFDETGRQHMEYLGYRDASADVPVDEIKQAFRALYKWKNGGPTGDFEVEAVPERS